MRKINLVFRTLLILGLFLLTSSSITFANSYNNYRSLTTNKKATLPEQNQGSSIIRTYDFVAGETVSLNENIGITSRGMFSVNGISSDTNTILFNKYSGFDVSRVQTTLSISNVTMKDAQAEQGSVIYNTANDAVITINNSVFESNSTLSQTNASGGAIYSTGTLKLTNTSFIGNSATVTEDTGIAKGGAIYSKNSVQLVADSDNVEIIDNFIQIANGEKVNEAIYIDNADATLNLHAINSGKFSISDSINGAEGYNVTMTGDGTGRIGLYNSIYNADISAENIDISFANGKVGNHSLDNLTIGNNVNFVVDADLANGLADTLSSVNGTGVFNLSELNVISAPVGNEVKLQVLKDAGNITLNIDKLLSKHTTSVKSTMYNDSIIADSITIGTTDTTNDSLIVNGWKDVLYEMVQDKTPSHMIKNFIFRTDTEYTITRDLGEMPQESILSILNHSGVSHGVINANGYSMFKMLNPITSVVLRDIIIKGAKSSENGAVAFISNNTASFSAYNSIITNNTSEANGGAFYVKQGTLSLNNSTVSNNTAKGDGGALFMEDEANVEITNTSFVSNKAEGKGGAIYTTKDLAIKANKGTVTFEGNTANGESSAIYVDNSEATLTLDARKSGVINMKDKISGTEDGFKMKLTGDSKSRINISETVSNADITFKGTTLYLAQDNLLAGNEFHSKGGRINLMNNAVGTTDFSKLTITGDTKLYLDVDLSNRTMDRLLADEYGDITGKVQVMKMDILADGTGKNIVVDFAEGRIMDKLISKVKYAYSPIYRYAVYYNYNNGQFIFNKGEAGPPSYKLFNPAVLPAGIAQQTVAMNAIRNYEYSMYHSDTYMMLPKYERFAALNTAKYAIADEEGSQYPRFYIPVQEEVKNIWVRSYTSFEDIPLNLGPKVSSINFGTVFGGDSDLIQLGKGFNLVYGGYAGYNGNLTTYEGGIDSTIQGGMFGATAHLYKGNFFNSFSYNIGWMVSDTSTRYGTDYMNMLNTGFVDRFGYNIEIAEGKCIIQPSLMMGYTFVHTMDYTSSNDIRIEVEPLHVMHFAPRLKIMGNLENGWQPYAIISIVANFIDKTNYYADTVKLPEMSIDPYVEYGLGIQKRWEDKYSGYAQATVRGGGRRGVSLLFGFRYMMGKILARDVNIAIKTPKFNKPLFKQQKDADIEIDSITSRDNLKAKLRREKLKEKQQRVAKVDKKPEKVFKQKAERVGFGEKFKKIKKLLTIKYNTDVSAKVVSDVYSDGVIITSIKGMKKGDKSGTDFKDLDRINKNNKIKSQVPTNFSSEYVETKPYQPEQNVVKTAPVKPVSYNTIVKTMTETIKTPQVQTQQLKTVEQKEIEHKPVVETKTVDVKPVINKVEQPIVEQSKVIETNKVEMLPEQKEEIKSVAPVVQETTNSFDIKPINVVNKKRLYLNQSKVVKPVKKYTFVEYETEVIEFKF